MATIAPLQKPTTPPNSPYRRAPTVVIGMGPVGIRVTREILTRDAAAEIVIYGDEPWEPYNRIQLSSLLTGQDSLANIYNGLTMPETARVTQHFNRPVVAINRTTKTVVDAVGESQSYGKLVIATGSRARLPKIPKIHLKGVFRFRDLNDAERLLARTLRSRHTVVLGGGLLGLEAARGMRRRNTRVTVIESANHLMSRQLDEVAGDLLRQHLLSMGIHVVLRERVIEVLGTDEVEGLRLLSGKILACDTLVVAVGIAPNIELARQAGLHVRRGIRIDDRLQTSDPDIFAIGECAEHRDTLYGTVAPGFEQAAVVAHRLCGGNALYTGSMVASALKVVGRPVFSMGRVGEATPGRASRNFVYEDHGAGIYRKLVVHRHRIIGAVAIGDWPEQQRIREAIERSRRAWPWQLKRFTFTGLLWAKEKYDSVLHWPAATTICNCNHVTRGELGNAIRGGCDTLERIGSRTGAGTVCGACKPLLAQLLGCKAEPIPGHRAILLLSVAALLFSMLLATGSKIAYPSSAAGPAWDALWRDNLYRQISGYTLLATVFAASLLSLRKRTARFSCGAFGGWRLFHVLAGIFALAVLAAHTGLRLGANLNFFLMTSFCAAIALGAGGALAAASEHRLPEAGVRKVRSRLIQLHIVLLWPLPVLLAFHILKTYYF